MLDLATVKHTRHRAPNKMCCKKTIKLGIDGKWLTDGGDVTNNEEIKVRLGAPACREYCTAMDIPILLWPVSYLISDSFSRGAYIVDVWCAARISTRHPIGHSDCIFCLDYLVRRLIRSTVSLTHLRSEKTCQTSVRIFNTGEKLDSH